MWLSGDLAVLASLLSLMILKAFPNQNDSMILTLYVSVCCWSSDRGTRAGKIPPVLDTVKASQNDKRVLTAATTALPMSRRPGLFFICVVGRNSFP